MKTTRDLRKYLIKQMEGVVEGTVNTDVAKGVCNLAQQIYNTVNLEIKHAHAVKALGAAAIKAVNFDEDLT